MRFHIHQLRSDGALQDVGRAPRSAGRPQRNVAGFALDCERDLMTINAATIAATSSGFGLPLICRPSNAGVLLVGGMVKAEYFRVYGVGAMLSYGATL